MSSMLNYITIREALEKHQEVGRIKEVSTTWTQSGTVRFDITNNDGRFRRYTLGEASAFLWGLMSQIKREDL